MQSTGFRFQRVNRAGSSPVSRTTKTTDDFVHHPLQRMMDK